MAREEALDARTAKFRKTQPALARGRFSRLLDHGPIAGVAANRVWNGAKWSAMWWLLCSFAWSWDARACAVAAIMACAFMWQMLDGLGSLVELARDDSFGTQ